MYRSHTLCARPPPAAARPPPRPRHLHPPSPRQQVHPEHCSPPHTHRRLPSSSANAPQGMQGPAAHTPRLFLTHQANQQGGPPRVPNIRPPDHRFSPRAPATEPPARRLSAQASRRSGVPRRIPPPPHQAFVSPSPPPAHAPPRTSLVARPRNFHRTAPPYPPSLRKTLSANPARSPA